MGPIFSSYTSLWFTLEQHSTHSLRHISNMADSANMLTKRHKVASPKVVHSLTRNKGSTTDSSSQNFMSWIEMPKNSVGTFSVEALSMDDAVDFSGQYQAEILPSSRVNPFRVATFSNMVFHYGVDSTTNSYLPFPSHTKGFLYYYLPEGHPPLAGSLRFRVVPSLHPYDFRSEQDLRGPDGKPWSVPLLELPRAHPYKHMDRDISRMLKREGVLSLEESDACHAFAERRLRHRNSYRGKPYNAGQILHIHNPHFLLRFDTAEVVLNVIDGSRVETVSIPAPVQATLGLNGAVEFPYSGEAVCEFIKSPRKEFLFIRILDLNTPVTKSLDPDLYTYTNEHEPTLNKILVGVDGMPTLVPSSPALAALLQAR